MAEVGNEGEAGSEAWVRGRWAEAVGEQVRAGKAVQAANHARQAGVGGVVCGGGSGVVCRGGNQPKKTMPRAGSPTIAAAAYG